MATAIAASSLHHRRPGIDTAGSSIAYWDDRADRFAAHGSGLAAVCSYGMPWFYNGSIHFLQRLALRRWLDVAPGTRVLEIGCGVGRWSRRLARRGAVVTGIDLSRKMVAVARRNAEADGRHDRCRFLVADVCAPAVTGRFDLVLGVTVLQHVLDPARLDAAIAALAERLAPGGRAILLEAAPTRRSARCDSGVFVARDAATYVDAFARAGLRCVQIRGVDPAPFKTWFLPYYRTLPRPLALTALAAVTVAGLIPDVIAGRAWAARSWHKVFVLAHRDVTEAAAR